jgi:hypothetical protein
MSAATFLILPGRGTATRSGVVEGALRRALRLGPLHHRAAPGGPPPRPGEDL